MQDTTYVPRNFATLGSLELQPSFFADYIQREIKTLYIFPTQNWTKVTANTSLFILLTVVFVVNSYRANFAEFLKNGYSQALHIKSLVLV